MPKVILEFNLPEEEVDFQYAKDGSLLHIVIGNTLEEIRKHLKYDETLSKKERQVYESLRDFIYNNLREYNIDI